MRQHIAVMAALCLFVGCSDELKKEGTPVDARIEQLSANQLNVRVIGQKNPNEYEVQIAWPAAKGSVRVSEKSKILGVVSASDKVFTQSLIAGGSDLSYLVEHLTVDGRIASSIPIFLKVPKDILFEGNINLSANQKFEADRVFIATGAVITNFDKNLVIMAKELISNGGTIQNFEEVSQANWDRNGRSGGMINIVTQKAVGTLQVFLRGENGGHGRNGAITFPGRHPGCAGANGGSGGNSGSLNINILKSEDLNVSFTVEAGKKGIAGTRGSAPSGPESEVVNPPCDRDAPEGLDGSPGSKGQICLKLSAEQEYACQ